MTFEINDDGFEICGNCEAPLEEKYSIMEPTGGKHCPECGVRLI